MKVKNHWLWYLLTSIVVLALVILCYAYKSWRTTTSTIMTNTSAATAQKVKDGRPFSILIMGTDIGALGRGTSYAGNTDTMELITVNPSKKEMTMIAIPRDTLVKVDTKKGADYVKINAAYAIGGAAQAKRQVSELLNVPVDYYALMNMGTLEKVVDAVGGVDVNNPFAFNYEGHHFKKGYQHLDGKTALEYSRMRYDDPDNDYGRQRRGQQVIQSVVNSFKKKGSIAVANKIMTAVQDGVRTDAPVNDIASLYLNYRQALQSTVKVQFRGKDAMIEGTSFQIAVPSEINRVSRIARQSLGLPVTGKINNNETAMANFQTNWNGINDLNFVLPHHAKYNQPGSGD